MMSSYAPFPLYLKFYHAKASWVSCANQIHNVSLKESGFKAVECASFAV